MELGNVFLRIANALDAAQIPYMLVGSFASSYHGAPRSTADIDIVIDADPKQLRVLIESLRNQDYYAEIDDAIDAWRRRSMFNVLDTEVSWKIDFIFLKPTAFNREEFRRRKPVQFQGISLFVASAEDVILSKLEWGKMSESGRQMADVVSLLKKIWADLDHGYLDRWLSELGLVFQFNAAKQAAGLE